MTFYKVPLHKKKWSMPYVQVGQPACQVVTYMSDPFFPMLISFETVDVIVFPSFGLCARYIIK